MSTLRVEHPAQWRWGIADAAFLARVVQRLDTPQREVSIEGLPQDLHKLLMLARTKASSGAGEPAAPPSVIARVGVCSRWSARATCTPS